MSARQSNSIPQEIQQVVDNEDNKNSRRSLRSSRLSRESQPSSPEKRNASNSPGKERISESIKNAEPVKRESEKLSKLRASIDKRNSELARQEPVPENRNSSRSASVPEKKNSSRSVGAQEILNRLSEQRKLRAASMSNKVEEPVKRESSRQDEEPVKRESSRQDEEPVKRESSRQDENSKVPPRDNEKEKEQKKQQIREAFARVRGNKSSVAGRELTRENVKEKIDEIRRREELKRNSQMERSSLPEEDHPLPTTPPPLVRVNATKQSLPFSRQSLPVSSRQSLPVSPRQSASDYPNSPPPLENSRWAVPSNSDRRSLPVSKRNPSSPPSSPNRASSPVNPQRNSQSDSQVRSLRNSLGSKRNSADSLQTNQPSSVRLSQDSQSMSKMQDSQEMAEKPVSKLTASQELLRKRLKEANERRSQSLSNMGVQDNEKPLEFKQRLSQGSKPVPQRSSLSERISRLSTQSVDVPKSPVHHERHHASAELFRRDSHCLVKVEIDGKVSWFKDGHKIPEPNHRELESIEWDMFNEL